ncbi:unnamed protein product [Dicrocoelium dendriticum]|nr:unnamed protein product [Dicrocoelium dendriticum]
MNNWLATCPDKPEVVLCSRYTKHLTFPLFPEVPKAPKIDRISPSPNGFVLTWSTERMGTLLSHRVSYEDEYDAAHTEWAAGADRQVVLRRMQKCRVYNVQMWAENRCGLSPASELMTYQVEPQTAPNEPKNIELSGTTEALKVSWTKLDTLQETTDTDILLVDGRGGSRTYWAPGDADSFVLQNLRHDLNYTILVSLGNACGWSQFSKRTFSFDSSGELVIA